MAENKKLFVAYSDWNETFKKLTDDEAGRLAKHFVKNAILTNIKN